VRLNLRTAVTVLAVAVLVVVVLLVGDRSRDDGRPTTSDDSATAAPTASTSTSQAPEPATIPEFCEAFLELAERHGDRVAAETPENEARVDEQGLVVLEIGRRLPVPDDIRAGLEGFVQDVMRDPVTATPAEVAAFSTFLSSSCPA
jgi:hypothetical protein